MAKRRRKSGKSKRRRRNPSNPSNPPRRRAAARTTHRRRRNPREGFGDRAMKLAGGAIVALATGSLVVFGMGKLSATHPNIAEYGLPAAGFLTGVALYKTHPTLGAGMALGAAAPFALPLGGKLLVATQQTTTPATTAAGIGRAIRAAQMGAVQMGAVQMGRAYRGYG